MSKEYKVIKRREIKQKVFNLLSSQSVLIEKVFGDNLCEDCKEKKYY